MLAIRLRRTGARKNAHYRVVVTDRKSGRDGRFLEVLGHYHPRSQPHEVSLDMERTEVWLGKGAQMSDTVRSLYKLVQSGTAPAETAAAPVATPEPEETLAVAAEEEAAEEGAAEVETEDADGGEEE